MGCRMAFNQYHNPFLCLKCAFLYITLLDGGTRHFQYIPMGTTGWRCLNCNILSTEVEDICPTCSTEMITKDTLRVQAFGGRWIPPIEPGHQVWRCDRCSIYIDYEQLVCCRCFDPRIEAVTYSGGRGKGSWPAARDEILYDPDDVGPEVRGNEIWACSVCVQTNLPEDRNCKRCREERGHYSPVYRWTENRWRRAATGGPLAQVVP